MLLLQRKTPKFVYTEPTHFILKMSSYTVRLWCINFRRFHGTALTMIKLVYYQYTTILAWVAIRLHHQLQPKKTKARLYYIIIYTAAYMRRFTRPLLRSALVLKVGMLYGWQSN